MPLLLIAYLGFISLGLPDVVIGVAWPSMRDEFDLAQSTLGAAVLGFGGGYLLSSVSAGALVTRLGIGTLLTLSSALVVIALAGYALTPLWAGVVVGALLLGAGSGAIDVGLNAYAARFFSAGQMNWLHASWGIGATLGPLLMTRTLAAGGSWRSGYWLIALILLAMTVLFALSRRRWRRAPADDEQSEKPRAATLLRRPLVWLQITIFFLYTGLEAGAGLWSFTLLTEQRGVTLAAAGLWVSIYWGALAAGRVLCGFIVDRVGSGRLLALCACGLVLATALIAQPTPALNFLGLALLGLSLAPFFPCLVSDTPRRVGVAAADHVIGYQMGAALLGASLLPALTGLLVDVFSLAVIGAVLVVLALLLAGLYFMLLRLDRRAAGARLDR